MAQSTAEMLTFIGTQQVSNLFNSLINVIGFPETLVTTIQNDITYQHYVFT